MDHAVAHLMVLPCRLQFARLPLESLRNGSMSHTLLQLLFGFKHSGGFDFESARAERHFFSYTQTPNEISLILEEHDAALFLKSGLELVGEGSYWKAIQISEGDLGFQATGIVQRLSTPLARASISVMYFSTFLTDFIFVQEEQVAAALQCLRACFTITIEDAGDGKHEIDPAQKRDGEAVAEVGEGGGNLFAAHSLGELPNHNHLLKALPLKLCITRLEKRMAYLHIPALIQLLMFSPTDQPALLSFTETDDEISLIHEEGPFTVYAHEMQDEGFTAPAAIWTPIQIGEEDTPLGFEEAGIVASTSSTLAKAEPPVSIFYLSTFSNDFVFVPSEAAAQALQVLGQHFEHTAVAVRAPEEEEA
jgi:hypothetical protein